MSNEDDHWSTCYREADHHSCAVARVHDLEDKVRRLQPVGPYTVGLTTGHGPQCCVNAYNATVAMGLTPKQAEQVCEALNALWKQLEQARRGADPAARAVLENK